ncbi:MAG: hypothetical protein JWO63_2652 [Frankiales bacterium]|nr:hypothetical protein [Frankiales bacterium]
MAGDAQATRQRLLDAAAAEFAAYGIAGARVDRIAAAAKSNKAQIYHYFGSKDALFDAVFEQFVTETLLEAPIDVEDLPEYAGRLFDRYEKSPNLQRIATWYRLERSGTKEPLTAIVESNRHKIAAIAAAQRAGELPDRFADVELLGLVLSISSMWASATPEFDAAVRKHSAARRRAVVTEAVAALLQAR